MVSAWFMDAAWDGGDDPRAEHRCSPDRPVTLQELEEKTGVLFYRIPVYDDGESFDKEKLDKIRHERGYSYMDEVNIHPEHLPNYDEKIGNFCREHIHSDEEIRFVLKGSGYYDVRETATDHWIRLHLVPGDMIVLPAGVYHRFVLDKQSYIKAQRLFVGEPVWTPIYRPCDDHPARTTFLSGFPVTAQT